MKTLYKILAVIILIFVVLLFVLPIIYKSEIINLTKVELNKNVNAKIEFGEIDFSLIRSFPDFSLTINNLTIIGKDDFHKDTLANIESISAKVDLISVFKGENYKLKKITVNKPIFKIKVLKDGKANYDISLPAETNTNQGVGDENSSFKLAIKKFQIIDGHITYDDDDMNLHLKMDGFNHNLSGKLSADNSILVTNTKVASLNLTYDGIDYFTDVAAVYNANIDADLKNQIYTLGKNELILNEFPVNFEGSVSFVGKEDINLVITFNTQKSTFKNALSLIPAVYYKDFEGIKTDGKVSLNGFVKGIYNENNLPSFNISLIVENAMFKYPGLPQSVTNININSVISNKGGITDNTLIDVSRLEMRLGENPLHASLNILNPVSDPKIKSKIAGELNLATIKDFYPIENSDNLSGKLIFDVILDGKMSSIEKEKYEEFSALGFIKVEDVKYKTSSFNEIVNISTAQLNFSPAYLDLVNFKAKIGRNDLKAKGKIENYLSYYFNTSQLGGNIDITSEYLNIDELFAEEKKVADSSVNFISDTLHSKEVSMSVVEIPKNINFNMSTKIKKLIYDKIEMDDFAGNIQIANQSLILKNLNMNALEGEMTINGSYSSLDIEKPKVDLNFNIKDINIPMAYEKFAIIKKYLPLTNKTIGTLSSNFKFNTILTRKMAPDYSTLNGEGSLWTSKIIIEGLNSLVQIGETLDYDKFKKLEIDKIMAEFKFEDGKMIVNPTDFKYKNINGNIEGFTAFNQSIEYKMNLQIPKEELGSKANKMISDLMSGINILSTNFKVPDIIPVDVIIGGTLINPIVKTKLSNIFSNSIIDKTKDEISETTKDEAQKIIDDAEKQANYLISEAEKKAKLIKNNASTAVDQLNTETEKQASDLIAEGKKNGYVAENIAKEAAKVLKEESKTKGAEMISLANKNADSLVSEAKNIAANLKKEAQKQADDILKK